MQMVKVNVSELSGAALDWSVAKCDISSCWILDLESFMPNHRLGRINYSTDWAQGGRIIERELICLKHGKYIETSAYIYSGDGYAAYVQGPTALDVAMRCYVASKLGDVVEVPSELLK